MKYTVIFNPASGRGKATKALPWIKTELQRLGIHFNLNETQSPGHAEILALKATEQSDVLIAAGGDGTVNEVINGILKSKRDHGRSAVLGVLPIGQGNDFAFSMNIPFDLQKSCEIIAGNFQRNIDAGVIRGDIQNGERYFGNGIGIGFDAMVGIEASKIRHLRGFPAYLIAVIKTILLNYKAPLIELTCNDTSWQQHSLMVSIMNGKRMGGGFLMAPNAVPDDGLLDLCIGGQVSRPALFPLIPRFLRGTQEGHPQVRMDLAPGIRVTAVQGDLVAHADGESLCQNGRCLEIDILPGQLRILTAEK